MISLTKAFLKSIAEVKNRFTNSDHSNDKIFDLEEMKSKAKSKTLQIEEK